MKLPFEQWLTTQTLTQDARDLFSESIVCFKAGADRAALLFAYLGFQSTIRDRILVAGSPTGFVPGHWASTQLALRDDGTWDAKAFESTQNKKTPIFDVSDEVRDQVAYWKNRRNDCAHSKANAIGSPHVESFWLFVQSNLAKMVVIGSSQSLLARIERHFDPTYTNPDTDPLPLAVEIASAVDRTRLNDFLDNVVSVLSVRGLFGTYVRAESSIFFDAVFRQPDAQIQNAMVAYLAAHEAMLVAFLRHAPARVLLFANDAALIRRMWTVHTFENGLSDFPLYAALLRNNLIPTSELAAANLHVVSRMKGGAPSPLDAHTLASNGFIAAFDRHAFEEGFVDRFDWGNYNGQAVRWRLEQYPMTDVAVTTICAKFADEPCAHGPRDSLIQLFAENAAKKVEFQQAAARIGATLPSQIPSLT